MNNYVINLRKIDLQQKLHLSHKDKFSDLMIHRMVTEAMNREKWDGSYKSYIRVKSYMVNTFGFKQTEEVGDVNSDQRNMGI